jgi:hypothetical protein
MCFIYSACLLMTCLLPYAHSCIRTSAHFISCLALNVQASKFAQLLKPLFLSPRHSVAPNRKSFFETICTFLGIHNPIQTIINTYFRWFPFSLFNFFSNPHQANCKKCSFSHSGIGASIVSEYDGIKRDILDLANPLISPSKKLELTGRMRIAYHCLSV